MENWKPPVPQSKENNVNEAGPRMPEKLYRGFVVNPSTLSLETFSQPLRPTATSGMDGNEKGIYMSDNLRMVESTNYSAGVAGIVEVPVYDMGRGRINSVPLPGCGVIIEIDVKGVSVREPRISSVFQGHYNNGFQGKEWIADAIEPDHYRVKKLIFGIAANDPAKMVMELKDGSKEELNQAILHIKELYEEKKKEAEEFKEFLISLPEVSRLSGFMLKRKWENYLQAKKESESKNPA